MEAEHPLGALGALAPQMSSSEASGSELSAAEPLLARRRRRSSQIDREQFSANRQEAAQEAIFQVRGVWLSTMFLGFLVIVLATYFEVRSLYVLYITYGLPCDQPLWRWLCGHIVLGMLREFCFTPLKNAFLIAHIVWTFYGFSWFGAAHTCKSTNPELFFWAEIVLIVAAVFLAASTLLPLVLYLTLMILILLVNQGVISNQKAARDGTIDRLEVVLFDPGLFQPAEDPDDPRPSGDCCCCTEAFDAEKPIVKTPCGHYYHKECLHDWLKLARTCPLCRLDLDEVVWSSPAAGPPVAESEDAAPVEAAS
eukprot:TRINITY_DN100471_c0_g1_i1.p1 TRINITY_DN100471_c0_g1~~TRINITY_DN100471_c0_g1_i1.p1  ORF type:complete len:310 (+),score=52.25 TRINITY_DN100471_c0_g1_i1:169-1098(+)